MTDATTEIAVPGASGLLHALPSVPGEVALARVRYESREAARALLARAREALAPGATLELRVDAANVERAALLEEAGFALVQEKDRYERAPARAGTRLTYRTRAEVGDSAFVAAIARVTEGTLDREDRRTPAGAYFGVLRDLDDRPGWWALAFFEDALAGLIVPQSLEGLGGVIDYIGVVPELRGRRFAGDLIARALDTLAAAGETRCVADVDRENHPSRRAFERAGFVRTAGYRLFRA